MQHKKGAKVIDLLDEIKKQLKFEWQLSKKYKYNG